ncbi:N-acetyltransferase [Xanthomonas sp. 3498]|uniref:GNAT family N-acetyltransferase n=1 Tax=Xanthomonas sp. 3498 TaxID=2663863 RepID=UPI00161C126B|nr:N-acetyltransferase [Xanthomonas sp. 3498]MBB5878172.1 ribosomal protein S18 acetylase RimI-like enzyme [Xanthomonas sp. 3498]
MMMRAECVADLPALRALFRHHRWPEFAMLPWDDAAKVALLDQQFDAQRRHYAAANSEVRFLVLLHGERLAGRIYLGSTQAGDLRLLDILLSSEDRGQGIGAALIGAVQAQAAARGRRVLLEVDKANPAACLYHRLGFRVWAETPIGWQMAWSGGAANA